MVGARAPSEAAVLSGWAAALCVAFRGSQELGSHSMGGQRLGREFTTANRTGRDRPGGEVPGNAPAGDYRVSEG